ncbi:hypothetical protein [Paenibacillus sp. WC2504]|uniref:hypothetical protein n=1 Tax=Paenibacillus sp. WC2504 TaxID=3461403 RepID=UPI0040464B80
MEYNVKHKETGEHKTLSHLEVNDMEYTVDGLILVFDTNMEAYLLLEDLQE